MRIVQYTSDDGAVGCGIERDGAVLPSGYPDTLALIRDGERGLETAERAADGGQPVRVQRLLAPLTSPGKILGSGVNYRSHGDEEPGYVFPDEVVWDFIKLSTAIVGPGDAIVIPPTDDVIQRGLGSAAPLSEYGFAVDYEVELGVVLGARAKNVDSADALDHVFGYTVFNDVGSRSVQFHNGQRDLGKNFDTFCPMGPCIVTKDELPDWEQIRIQSHVNGELRQDALVGEQIGPPPVAIEWLSSIITLEPGDCLMTGTPAGCGTFSDPPRFLQPGDTVRVSASGIGELENPVVAGTARTKPGPA
ncbi:MAG TPA: fumarylacetoacetate hydrolase family protein [Gaiellaceae bacterium]|jgi:2-keto-4-pentenoate hydratase/2-oxohepta-3-ene-1,7-dioic acid hydratase in catechol pathway